MCWLWRCQQSSQGRRNTNKCLLSFDNLLSSGPASLLICYLNKISAMCGFLLTASFGVFLKFHLSRPLSGCTESDTWNAGVCESSLPSSSDDFDVGQPRSTTLCVTEQKQRVVNNPELLALSLHPSFSPDPRDF